MPIARLEAIVARGLPPTETLTAVINDRVSHIFDVLDRFANVLRNGSRISAESHAAIRALQHRYERQVCGIIERASTMASFTTWTRG